jgi:formamidopyrimidine-DNA glycosylase
MPELPEVETIARILRPELVGATILDADLRWRRTLAAPTPKKFKELIKGQVILAVGRRAKFLVIQLTTYNLLIHMRMSGDLLIKKGKIKPEKHDRLILLLSAPSAAQTGKASRDGGLSNLVFNDPRKFGRVWLTDDLEQVLGGLGPEPLSDDFTPQWLYENLHRRKRQLKPLLLDQSFLAGLGNIYTDEALHMAKLHPLAGSATVTAKQAEALRNAIRAVLEAGIQSSGASIDWVYRGGDYQNHFRVYGRLGQPCPVCGTSIERILVGQRGTHICPRCQAR